ncbi:MAG: hypothetical protein ACHQ50_10990 [Fimbriimonadales bacterium]
MRKFVLLPVVGCLAWGCGGNSANLALGSNEGQVQQGWTWTYQGAGTLTPQGGSAQTADASMTVTCTNRTGSRITLSESVRLAAQGGVHTYTTQLIYDQDSQSNALTLVSRTVGNGQAQVVQSTTFAIPGAWVTNMSVTGSTTYTDSTTQTDSLDTTADLAYVPTHVGQFLTFTTTDRVVYQGVVVRDLTAYFDPPIMQPTKMTGTVLLGNDSFTGTFILQSTNVPLPGYPPG